MANVFLTYEEVRDNMNAMFRDLREHPENIPERPEPDPRIEPPDHPLLPLVSPIP